MPPILMTRQERATLARLAASPAPINEVPQDQVEKFVNHGLALRDAFRLRITTKGQLELFRQRFRRMPTRRKVTASTHDFLGRLDRHLSRQRRQPTVFHSLTDKDDDRE